MSGEECARLFCRVLGRWLVVFEPADACRNQPLDAVSQLDKVFWVLGSSDVPSRRSAGEIRPLLAAAQCDQCDEERQS
jgi:hypothetical protein